MVSGYFAFMSATISISQDALLDELLAAGRWRNKSEIVRHALELVKMEVERERLEPFKPGELAAELSKLTDEEAAAAARLAAASAYPKPGDL